MLNTTELLRKVAAEPAELHTAVDAPTLRKLWNAQASFVHRCLLNGKGVRVHNFGEFNFAIEKTPSGNKGDKVARSPTFSLQHTITAQYGFRDSRSGLRVAPAPVAPINFQSIAQNAEVSRDLAQELSGAIFRSAIRRAAAGEANVELNFGFAKINLRKGSVSVRFEPSFVADVQEHENQSLHPTLRIQVGPRPESRASLDSRPAPFPSADLDAADSAAAGAAPIITTDRPSSARPQTPTRVSVSFVPPGTSAGTVPAAAAARPLSARSASSAQRPLSPAPVRPSGGGGVRPASPGRPTTPTARTASPRASSPAPTAPAAAAGGAQPRSASAPRAAGRAFSPRPQSPLTRALTPQQLRARQALLDSVPPLSIGGAAIARPRSASSKDGGSNPSPKAAAAAAAVCDVCKSRSHMHSVHEQRRAHEQEFDREYARKMEQEARRALDAEHQKREAARLKRLETDRANQALLRRGGSAGAPRLVDMGDVIQKRDKPRVVAMPPDKYAAALAEQVKKQQERARQEKLQLDAALSAEADRVQREMRLAADKEYVKKQTKMREFARSLDQQRALKSSTDSSAAPDFTQPDGPFKFTQFDAEGAAARERALRAEQVRQAESTKERKERLKREEKEAYERMIAAQEELAMLEAKKKEASRSASRVAFRAALDSQLLEKRLRENRDVSVPDSPLPIGTDRAQQHECGPRCKVCGNALAAMTDRPPARTPTRPRVSAA